MANPNLKVKIGAEMAEIKSALASLRGDLAKTKKEAASTNVNGLTSSLKGLAGTIAGIGAVGLAIRGIFNATVAAEKAQAQLNAVLKSTGGAAGLTAKELNNMAEGLQQITTFDDEAITGAQSLLLTFTKIGREVFPEATKSTLNMSIALGQDLKSSALLVGKALNDPIKGVASLTRAGVQFTAEQKNMITSLVETGRVAEAQRVILKELEVQFGGSAEAARNTLGGALQGLKNDFDNLLEGDSGNNGTRGATESINELAAAMRSPEVKAGFNTMVSGIVSVTEAAAIGLTKLVELTDFIGKRIGEAVVGTAGADGDIKYIEQRLKSLRDLEANFLTRDFTGRDAQKIKEFEKLLDEAKAAQQRQLQASIFGSISDTSKAPKYTPPVFAPGSSTGTKASSGGSSAAAAKAKLDAADKAEADRQAAIIKDRNERIAKGMFEVNNALLVATGNAAEASKQEIEAKYAELLKDLRDAGASEADILSVNKLIDFEKAKAELDALRDKTRAVLESLRSETAFINDQVGIPGGITATDAELQLQAVRQKTLEQLIQLRVEAEKAYNAKPSPETLAALRELNVAIGQVQQTQNEFANQVKDGAVNALTGFFSDLATGAKSFKEAFKDMVRNFVQGIAQMIAQKLALKAVDAIAGAFGFHGGGRVGAGGGFRREVSPLLFAGAPRYHSGGIAGLKPGEVPAILQTGERVLSRNETARYQSGQRPSPGTRVVNVFDPNFVPDQMDSAAGEKVILNVIGKNPSRVKQLLG